MPFTLGLDFETRSRVDLKAAGADNYAADASTDIICCSFINKQNGDEWLWYAGDPVPADLVLAINLAQELEAHNARFDQLIYEYIAVEDYGFPVQPKSKWVCTAAMCRVNALPASLDGATRAANAAHKKDHGGSALIRQLSIPNKVTGKFNFDPALIKKMGKYCLQDSRAMVSLTAALRQLSEADKLDWHVNERINDRGVKIDRELATLCQQYAEQEKRELGGMLSALTGGLITSVTQTGKVLAALKSQGEQHQAVIKCISKEGTGKFTLDKAARSQLLDLPEEVFGGIWREVVDIVDEGGKSSVSKFSKMLTIADPKTDRVHGAFIFAGAGQTGRFSSKGLQLHNMVRACASAEETEKIKASMRAGEGIYGVMGVLPKLLRPALIPSQGKSFVVSDWSAIEARVLPWLSNSEGGKRVLEKFIYYDENPDKGDIYIDTAASMNLDDRQMGKVANLSLGFGGSVGAFQAMAKNYGVKVDDGFAKMVVNRWRVANQWAVEFWKELEQAAIKAVRQHSTVYTAGRVRYIYVPHVLGGTLMCILPNDTVIQYPYARLEKGKVTAMKASVQPKVDSTDEWPRMTLWGGFQAENIAQATAGCLLKETLRFLDQEDHYIVGHVHDEIIEEVLDCQAEEAKEELKQAMEFVPEWAEGLPLKAVAHVMKRYGK